MKPKILTRRRRAPLGWIWFPVGPLPVGADKPTAVSCLVSQWWAKNRGNQMSLAESGGCNHKSGFVVGWMGRRNFTEPLISWLAQARKYRFSTPRCTRVCRWLDRPTDWSGTGSGWIETFPLSSRINCEYVLLVAHVIIVNCLALQKLAHVHNQLTKVSWLQPPKKHKNMLSTCYTGTHEVVVFDFVSLGLQIRRVGALSRFLKLSAQERLAARIYKLLSPSLPLPLLQLLAASPLSDCWGRA